MLKVQKQSWCQAKKEDLSEFQPQKLVQVRETVPPKEAAVEGEVAEGGPSEGVLESERDLLEAPPAVVAPGTPPAQPAPQEEGASAEDLFSPEI